MERRDRLRTILGSITETITADESNLTGIYFGDFEANLTFVLGMEPNSTFGHTKL